MNNLDIYRWSFKEEYIKKNQYLSYDTYWAASKIGVVVSSKLVDTYWGWPVGRYYPDGKNWTLDEAKENLDLVFVANLDDLELLTDNPSWYEDVIDLTHCNTSRNLKFIRKGQERSTKLHIEDLQRQIHQLQVEIDYKARGILSLQSDLKELIVTEEAMNTIIP